MFYILVSRPVTDWLEHALDAKGFMPEDEGLLLHRCALQQAVAGPAARGRHLLRQVRDLPRRGRPRGRRHRLHRRPPPRLGGEPGRVGAPRHQPRRPADRPDGHAAGLPPHHRGRRARGPGRRRHRHLDHGGPALAYPAGVALHRRRARRGAGPRRLRRLGALGARPADCSSSTTSSRTLRTAGVRRTSRSISRRSRAAPSPRWRRWARCGCWSGRQEMRATAVG